MDLYKQLCKGQPITLTDMKGNPFEVKAAFWGELMIGLKFTQNGKIVGKPLMRSWEVRNYLDQFKN